MTCDEARLNLSMAMDGELADSAETDVHLRDCADCRAYRGHLAGADEKLGDIARAMLPPTTFTFKRPSPWRRPLRIVGSVAALVLLSLTVVGIVLNTRRPDPQEVFLLGSTVLDAGETGRVRLHVRDGVTHAPIAGAKIVAVAKGFERNAESDAAGDATIEFDAPANVANIAVDFRVASPAGTDLLAATFKVRRPLKLFLSTDKGVYQPGQTIHARLLACGSNTTRPLAGEKARVTIETPDGTKVFNRELTTSEFGIAAVDFPLADEVRLGSYAIRVWMGDVESLRRVDVKRYALPKFRVTVTSDQRWAPPGATIHGTVAAEYFFGSIVEGTARVVATRPGATGSLFADEGALDGSGRFSFQGRIPDDVPDGTWLDLAAEAVDGAGHVERRSTRVRVSSKPLIVTFVPEGPYSREVENRAYLVVTRPDGVPVAATVAGDWSGETDAAGVARFPVPDLSRDYSFAVSAKDGSASTTTVFSPRKLAADSRSFALRIDRAVLKAGETLQVDAICAFPQGAVYVDVVRDEQILLTRRLDVRDGRGTLSFDLPPELSGVLQVQGYRLLPDGNVERDTRQLRVEPPQGLQIRIAPSKAEYRPGEEMPVEFEVTDAKGAPLRSALTLGVVDSAVYMLSPLRLGSEEVRPASDASAPRDPRVGSSTIAAKQELILESARRFNRAIWDHAPSVIVLLALGLWAFFVIRHVAKAFSKRQFSYGAGWIGLGVGLPLLLVPAMLTAQRSVAIGSLPGPDAIPVTHAQDRSPAETVRELFPETLYWTPELITDEHGRASLTLTAADSITSWTLSAGAVSLNGKLGAATADLRVFRDFFVDLDLPVELTEGDRITLPVAVHNHSAKARRISVEFSADAGLALEDDALKTVEVGPNTVIPVSFRVRAAAFGRPAITVRARGEGEDAVRRTIDIRPEGREVPFAVGDRVGGKGSFTVDIPADAREGTGQLWLKVYPGGASELLGGLDRIIRMPTGCFEQSSSATYPNILTALTLKEAGALTPEIAQKLDRALSAGYQKLLTFEDRDGGFALYPGQQTSPYLTAYAVLILHDFAKVHPVDPAIMSRSIRYLDRNEDDRRIGAATSSYIAWALAEAGYPRSDSAPLERRSLEVNDPYELALIANALLLSKSGHAGDVVERLATMAQVDSATARWLAGSRTVVGSHGEPADVETTALAVMALGRAGRLPLAEKGVTQLIRAKDPQGGWKTTQSTILALKALLDAGRFDAKPKEPFSVSISVNGTPIPAAMAPITPETAGEVHEVDLSRHRVRGSNVVEVTVGGDPRVSVQVGGRYFLPWERPAPPEGPARLTVSYDRTTLARNDTLVAKVGMQTAEGVAPLRTMIADIGLPPGFEVDEDDLRGLMTRHAVDRYELSPQRVVFYLPQVGQAGSTLVYRLHPRFAMAAKTPPSRLYEYYAPDSGAIRGPELIEVRD